jgi:hypothetical protein
MSSEKSRGLAQLAVQQEELIEQQL